MWVGNPYMIYGFTDVATFHFASRTNDYRMVLFRFFPCVDSAGFATEALAYGIGADGRVITSDALLTNNSAKSLCWGEEFDGCSLTVPTFEVFNASSNAKSFCCGI